MLERTIAAAAADDKEHASPLPTLDEVETLRKLQRNGWAELTPAFFDRILPKDAFAHRDWEVRVFPNGEGGWSVLESNDGGGAQLDFRSKEAALEHALGFVRRDNAELRVENWPHYWAKEGQNAD